MEINFYEQFNDFPNTELLKIVNRPQDYQSSAIEAASEILKGRQISEDEIRVTDEYFNNRDHDMRIKKEKAESLKNEVADFLQPIIQPGTTVETGKWINLFLVFMALEYLWALFVKVRGIIIVLQFAGSERQNGFEKGTGDLSYLFPIIFDIAYIIYIPVLFYLLYRKRRWGWILLFGDQLISFLLSICNSYFFFKSQSILHSQTGPWLFWIFLRGAFIYFLWQEKVTTHFNVPQQIKGKTVMASILLCLMFLAFLKFYFY